MNTNMTSHNFPSRIVNVICSDLDETFLPFNDENKKHSGIPELEQYLRENIEKYSVIFGWITGSNLESALRKTKGYISHYPHFIASSLGTEFHWIKHNKIEESENWSQLISTSGYKKENIDHILRVLNEEKIILTYEPEDYQGKYKATLYYYIHGEVEHNFKIIQEVASEFKVKVLFNKCNPAAGDPENCYDVEFIPQCCGKGEVIDFLIDELNLSPDNIYCFGDSFNDFSMFSRTKKSFLVGNADFKAKEKYPNILNRNYCFGIKDKLEELIDK